MATNCVSIGTVSCDTAALACIFEIRESGIAVANLGAIVKDPNRAMASRAKKTPATERGIHRGDGTGTVAVIGLDIGNFGLAVIGFLVSTVLLWLNNCAYLMSFQMPSGTLTAVVARNVAVLAAAA